MRYENIRQLVEANGSDTFAGFGRSLYKAIACGPWVSLLLANDREVYYTNEKAHDPALLDRKDVLGIRIGSIVEGSDVEVGPEELMFPFDSIEYNAAVKAIDDEADFYWKRDNEYTYSVEFNDCQYWVDVGPFGDIDYGEVGNTPQQVRNLFERWLKTEEAPLAEDETARFKGMSIKRMDKSMMLY